MLVLVGDMRDGTEGEARRHTYIGASVNNFCRQGWDVINMGSLSFYFAFSLPWEDVER